MAGTNTRIFSRAPSYKKMNLCNIHFHKNAEHKAAAYSNYAGPGDNGTPLFTCRKAKTICSSVKRFSFMIGLLPTSK